MTRNPRHILRSFNGVMPLSEPKRIAGLTSKRLKLVCKVTGYTIYEVDGAHVRAQHADFIGGSHHKVNAFIPKGDIWVDSTVKGEWKGFLASHELLEALLMDLQGWKYDQAHAAANALEQELRGVSTLGNMTGQKVATVWRYHLEYLFPKGEAVQTIADTIARMLWRFL